ncbi:hypothetical protein EOL70_13570 [Leucothrix sargassi]|nr:hypothetical protein EOL70_13570 [Leucothrix sargassi]
MKPIDYYISLSTEEKEKYAERAGCSIHHFKLNLFRVKGGVKKTPKHELLINLALASEGNVTIDEAIEYFHAQPIKVLAKEMGFDDIKPVRGQLEMNITNKPEKVGL